MPAPDTRDYFAELYIAGLFGDAGWSVYFPKRDVGFDFIVSRSTNDEVLIRPIQVKGLYPTAAKGDKTSYGYKGELSAVHQQMVLVLPFFSANERGTAPEQIAYMPISEFKKTESWWLPMCSRTIQSGSCDSSQEICPVLWPPRSCRN